MKRKGNFELLRIIAIVFIIASHVSGHGIMGVITSTPYIRWAEGPLINQLFTVFLTPGGDVGVGSFFLITGYFLITATKPRKLGPVVKQVMFYSILSCAMLLFMHFSTGLKVSMQSFAKQLLLPISGAVWWFLSAYILLCACSLMLNQLVERLTKRQYFFVIVFLLVFGYAGGKALDVRYYPLIRASWYYLVGGFIRRHGSGVSKSWCIAGFVLCWIAYAATRFQIGVLIADIGPALKTDALKMLCMAFLGPLASIFLFLLFEQLEIENSRAIQLLAPHTLAIYLLHESTGGRCFFWSYLFRVNGAVYDSVWFPLVAILVVACIVAIGLAIEYGRRSIIDPIFDRVYNKLMFILQ